MKTAIFSNWTTEEFIGYWDGKPKKFKPGESKYMPDYLARHFAKHLTNRELLRVGKDGNLIYKNGDKFTSPSKPEQVPIFMELFNKAYIADKDDELEEKVEDVDTLIEVTNKNMEIKHGKPSEDAQIIKSPDFEEDEFEGKPKE